MSTPSTPHQRAPGHLQAVTADRPRAQTPPPGVVLFQPGDLIPGADLKVVRKLGEGGFGVVYECQDLHLEIPVAVKLLTTNARTSPELVTVFKEESRALAKLDSEHIVRVRRFGVTQEAFPRPFLVMFKLDGHTLLDALANLGRFSEADTVLYGIHIGMGLAAAHAAGLVHRDIKPANIFLSKRTDPITGRSLTFATILDFGIARAASSGSPDSARLPVICSHPYCCPTQYEGRAYPQSDLYALAVTLFLMLTRDHPLGNYSSDRDWVRAKLVQRPKPQLVNEVIRELNLLRGVKKGKIPLVDSELEDLLDRCLAYDPEDRPGTAEAFVRSLEIIHERIKARSEADEDATLTEQGIKPAPRGARTVPEPPEWMRKRVAAEVSRSKEAMSASPPEVFESEDEANERLQRSTAIEALVTGLPLDSPPLTDAEVEAIRAGAQGRPQTLPNDVSQQLMIAGSTLQSPQAAQRMVKKWSTAGARVTFEPGADKTPVMVDAPALPAMPPAAPHERQRRGFTVARGSVIELPLSGFFEWKARAAVFIDRQIFHPASGTHWRVVALVVSTMFALTAGAVAFGLWLRAPSGSAIAEPAGAPGAGSVAAVISPPLLLSSAVPSTPPVVAPAVEPGRVQEPVAVPAVVPAPGHAPPNAPKSGPSGGPSVTSARAAAPLPAAATPAVPSPTASCRFCYLLDEPKAPSPAPSASPSGPPPKPAGPSKRPAPPPTDISPNFK